MTVYLKNATFIDWETLVFKTGHMAVFTIQDSQPEFIPEVPDPEDLRSRDVILDCRNKLVTKSFACAHHHIYSTLARGMPAPAKNPENFLEILKYVWWHLDKQLDLEMIRASALAAALYCAKNGVTFVIDHHASPFAVRGSLAVIKESFDAVGISHLLCYEISDRDGKQSRNQGFEETEDYLEKDWQGLVGLHASFTVGNETLERAVELAAFHKSGIHIHVAEDKADQADCEKKHKMRVIERLADAGALELPKTILAHCVHLNKSEADILANSRAWVVENVESNLNNNVGLANYSHYGNKIMLGTDGMHNDMLRSAKAAFLVGQTTEGLDFVEAYKRFRAVHHYLAGNQFKGDGNNNLVVLDYNPPTEINRDNFLGHFLHGLESGHVSDVISNGKLIVKDKQLQTLPEEETLSCVRKMGKRLWEKL
jgi:cytosine/adenosine deaminase-related metal-dependent hydrolase